jgi:putative transposase
MRYPAREKLEIIQLVEQSHLPARRTLEKLGIPRAGANGRRENSSTTLAD